MTCLAERLGLTEVFAGIVGPADGAASPAPCLLLRLDRIYTRGLPSFKRRCISVLLVRNFRPRCAVGAPASRRPAGMKAEFQAGNSLVPARVGNRLFPALIEAIERATAEIHIETYIFARR